MNSQDFDKCRQFLEDQLSKNIDNKELLATYQKLIELDPKYVDVIVRRWENFTGQQAIREADDTSFDVLPVST